MKQRWVWFVAARYILKKRRNPLSVLGIATGVLALIVILSVMNGFQLGFIESILEVSSYHLRIESFPPEKTRELQNAMLAVPGINAAVPFREFQGLARGRRPGQQAVLVRGLPPDALALDAGMKSRLDFQSGSFNISGPRYVILGSELARRLALRPGDEITLFSISGILSGGGEYPYDDYTGVETFYVTGVFRTGYFEYDASWAFVNIDSAKTFFDASNLVMGIKIRNRFHDRHIMESAQRALFQSGLSSIPGFQETRISSWRDYNRAFFNALRTEKLFMFILVGLIFIVVGLNIFQAQRRAVLERREEIGLLRAVGGTEKAVRFVFVCDGAIVGFTGATTGLVFGLLIASNIHQFFSIIEAVVNTVIDGLNYAAVFLGFTGGHGAGGGFSFFSPAIFYIREIPSRIIVHEVIIIFMFGFLSALIAAWFASRKISKIQPAEVLRYE